jgi:hypothetical protein
VRLNFNWNYQIYGTDTDHAQIFEADLRVKDSAGAAWGDWINLIHVEAADVDPDLDPPQLNGSDAYDLSLYDGKVLQVRFHFYDAEFDYWAAVDSVRVSGVALPAEIPVLDVSLNPDTNTLTLTWTEFGSKQYTVEYTTDLTAAWTQKATGLTSPSWSTALPGDATGYYRVSSSQ